MDLFNKWIGAITKPSETFGAEKGKASLGEGAKHIVIAGLIAGVFAGIGVWLLATQIGGMFGLGTLGAGFGALMFVGVLILTPIGALISWIIMGGIYYVLAKVLGGKGTYTTQVYLMALYMAPIMVISTILGLVPGSITATLTVGSLLTGLVSLYALYPLTMALKTAHEYSTGKAVATWAILWVIFIVIAVAFYGAILGYIGLPML